MTLSILGDRGFGNVHKTVRALPRAELTALDQAVDAGTRNAQTSGYVGHRKRSLHDNRVPGSHHNSGRSGRNFSTDDPGRFNQLPVGIRPVSDALDAGVQGKEHGPCVVTAQDSLVRERLPINHAGSYHQHHYSYQA